MSQKSAVHQMMNEALNPFRDMLGLLDLMPEDHEIPVCAFVDNLRTALEAAEARVDNRLAIYDKFAPAFIAMTLNSKEKAQ